jgi:hypothetical protein
MEVEFTLTVNDVLALLRHETERPSNRARKRYQLVLALFFFLAGATLWAWNPDGYLGPIVVGCGLVVLLLTLGQKSEAAQKIKQAFTRAAEQGLDSMLITISPGGITTRNRLAADSLKWEGIAAVETAPDHLFIFTTDRATCYIVPRRAFEGEQQFLGFVERARRYHEQSRAAIEQPPA